MPSFSIEAEGETNPLSVHDVLKTLSGASGSTANQQSLQVAAQQFANWEKTAGYYSLLQDVYTDYNHPEEVRFQAIIQLKNGIDKYWRKTATHAISKSEKEKIRIQALNAGVREPRQALALQNALMLAKIVRYEFPHDWPDVISVVIHHLRGAIEQMDSTHVSNILMITLQIIKELASGRLQRTKKSLESVAPELLNVLGQLYVNLVQRWSSAQGDDQSMINSHAALKTLRRLLIAGFEYPHREPLVQQLWNVLQGHQENIWSIWKQNDQNIQTQQAQLLMKHLFQYAKLYLDMARSHAASFVSLGCMDILKRSWAIVSGDDAKAALSGALEWSVSRVGDIDSEPQPIEKLALKALLLFRACIKMVFNPVQTFKYQHPQDKLDKKAAIEQIRSTVFTDDFVIQLMEILITQYFVLRPSDLRDWEQEPDEWEKREEEIADAWEFSLRSCSEKLFLDMVINYKELLVPRLLQVFQQHVTLDNHDVLLKDSLYSAIGTSAACIEDIFDFNSLLESTLVPEVQLRHPNYNILRRRIAILLGQWAPIKPESLDRKSIYQVFTFLLSSDRLNDHVVRVTAGRQLRLVLEPFEFKYEDFEPYAASILSNIMGLIVETDLSETKMALLETVRVAVTKLEDKIEPYAQAIMSLLPSLWTQSGEEHLMKQAILTMITAIVTSLGRSGVNFHGSILPVIHDAVQVDSEAIVYLLEDALDLWAAILQQTPTSIPAPSGELLALRMDLLPLLEMGSEHLRQCLELVESYTFLSPAAVLEPAFLIPILISLKGLLKMLSSTRARDASLGPNVLENIIAVVAVSKSFNDTTRPQATQHLVKSMIDTGYFGEVCRILKEAYDYHQDPRPNRKPPEVIGVGETSLFTLLSRLALLSPDSFIQSLSATNFSLDWLVAEWIGNFDSIGDAIRKKLQVMALTNLMRATNPPPTIMIDSLQSLMNIWTDIMTELSDRAADESQGDYLWSGAVPPAPEWPGETPEDSRKRAITNSDPTYVVNIRIFVAERLRLMIDQLGGPSVFEQEYLARIDAAIVKSFAQLQLL